MYSPNQPESTISHCKKQQMRALSYQTPKSRSSIKLVFFFASPFCQRSQTHQVPLFWTNSGKLLLQQTLASTGRTNRPHLENLLLTGNSSLRSYFTLNPPEDGKQNALASIIFSDLGTRMYTLSIIGLHISTMHPQTHSINALHKSSANMNPFEILPDNSFPTSLLSQPSPSLLFQSPSLAHHIFFSS